MDIEIYTDGAWSSASLMGGWGLVIVQNDSVRGTIGGYEPYTTNNRMEMSAIIAALKWIKNNRNDETHYTIFTDSTLVFNGMKQWYFSWVDESKPESKRWKTASGGEVKNQDLWKSLMELFLDLNADMEIVDVQWVKGHKDSQYNLLADRIAVDKRKELELEVKRVDARKRASSSASK